MTIGTIGDTNMRPSIIPVIHYADDGQAMRNAARAFDAGCEGVFLIHMEGRNQLLPRVAQEIKDLWPDRLVGINHLGMDAADAVRLNIATGMDMTWTDEQPTHSDLTPWTEAGELADAKTADPSHLIFVGVAFKHQRREDDPVLAAGKAVAFGFIPTTSGSATGVAANDGAIARLRDGLGPDASLGIASGVTPDNVHLFSPHLSHILVATGVSSSFHEFDDDLLKRLRAAV